MYPSLTYLDRYHNEGTRTYSDQSEYTEAMESFRPDSATPSFDLTLFSLPREQVHIYLANPDEELRRFYIPNERQALFCVHPQVIRMADTDEFLPIVQQYSSEQISLQVSPSSSTRTVYVNHSGLPPHALKVHFPFKISRYGRKMRDEVIEQAINVSKELELYAPSLDPQFAFLREVIGISINAPSVFAYGEGRGEHWGYLVREMTPFPASSPGQKYLIPGFALYGSNYFNPDLKPLLPDLIGSDSPLKYILEQIMFPIIRHWVHCFLQLGYMLEPHGQNVLLEVNAKGDIERIVHRDLSVGIDMRRRRDNSLADTNLNMYNRMESGGFLSITYDMFMAHHFFTPLITCARKYFPNLRNEDFQKPCRRLFAELFPNHRLYMPDTVYYFSSERDEFNKPLYNDTGMTPAWRP